MTLRSPSSQCSRHAFTLLELMVAITLMAFIIAAVYSSWWSVMKATKIGETYAAEAQRTRVAAKAVEDALVGTVVYGENARFYSFLIQNDNSDFGALAFTAHLSKTFPGSGLFGDQAVRRLTFTVEPDQDNTLQLVMTQLPVLQATNDTISPYPITLARNVTLFIPEVWDEQKGEWATDWLLTNQMPKMVRITIGVGHQANSKDPDEIISRVVELPGTAIMGDVQRPIVGPGGGGVQGGPGNNRPGIGGNGNRQGNGGRFGGAGGRGGLEGGP